MSEVEHVLAVQNRLGEGPRWNVEEQALYWVDIDNDAFHRFDPATGEHDRCVVGLPVGALGFRAAGGLIMATRDGFAVWDPQTQDLRFLADPEADRPAARFNDGAVDCMGRFWAGTMSAGPTSSLYRLDPDGTVHQMETGLTISNGIGWSPDNRTMYFTDTPRHVIYAYDFDATTGAIANRRAFVATPDEPGGPDGLAVDSEGGVWSARWGGWKVTRYDPAGAVERQIRLPVECPTSCAFGGAGLDALYITSAWTGVDPAQRANQPWAGDLFRVHVGIKGRPEFKFTG